MPNEKPHTVLFLLSQATISTETASTLAAGKHQVVEVTFDADEIEIRSIDADNTQIVLKEL